MGFNWLVYERYPALKRTNQMEVYKNGPENNRIQQISDTPASSLKTSNFFASITYFFYNTVKLAIHL
jgi:hypothetical protein